MRKQSKIVVGGNNVIMQRLIELVCVPWASSLPNGPYKAKKNEIERTTELPASRPSPQQQRGNLLWLPSATNLGQTKAKSAKISHYTCFPSSLSPERTRERRGISRFPSIETVELQTAQGSRFAPRSHCRSERCERGDEAWWRIRRGASYWREQCTSGNNEEFSFCLQLNETEMWMNCSPVGRNCRPCKSHR